jgi:O-antigen/teichoic acid export membrane protein
VPILLLANLCLGIYYNLSIWYKLSNKTLLGSYTAIFGAAITLLGNFIFIQTHSFIASAWTTLAAYAGMVILGYFMGKKHYHVPYPLTKIIVAIGCAVVLGYMAKLNFTISILASFISIPAYIIAIWYMENRKKNRTNNNRNFVE